MSFLQLNTEKAKQWAKDNLITKSWQWQGDELVGIEHRCKEDINDGLESSGLACPEDFMWL